MIVCCAVCKHIIFVPTKCRQNPVYTDTEGAYIEIVLIEGDVRIKLVMLFKSNKTPFICTNTKEIKQDISIVHWRVQFQIKITAEHKH